MSIIAPPAVSTARFSSSSPAATGSGTSATSSSPDLAASARVGSPALGQKVCRDDLPVLYHRVSRLLTALALARGDGRYAKLMTTLSRAKLLILDDWGPETSSAEQARDLLEIIEDRMDAGSILVTSQVPVDRWHDMIGLPTIADAILDRLVHNAYRIELKGESLRKRRKPDLT